MPFFSLKHVPYALPGKRLRLPTRRRGAALLTVLGLILNGGAWARAQQPAAPATPLSEDASLRQLMTPEQFKATGLKKLSPEELKNLESFLKGYREQAVQESAKVTEERINPPPRRDRATHQSVIEGRIQGHFAGLSGHTRVTLGDGSVWRQSNETDHFSANLDNPDIVLVKGVFGYKMYVTGAVRWFYVRQAVLN